MIQKTKAEQHKRIDELITGAVFRKRIVVIPLPLVKASSVFIIVHLYCCFAAYHITFAVGAAADWPITNWTSKWLLSVLLAV